MDDKTFIVTHAKARVPQTVTGKTLKAALKAGGLDPNIWLEVSPSGGPLEAQNGYNQGDGGPEGN